MDNPLATSFDNSKLKSEFTASEWKILKPILLKVILEKDEVLFKDGSEAEELYFLERGSLEVSKKGHRLAILGAGHWVGEIAALGDKLRTASVHATEKSILIKLSLEKLQSATKNNPDIYNKVITHLSRNMATRLQEMNKTTVASIKKQLELAKMRIAMGQFLCYILMALGCFFFILNGIALLDLNPKVSSAISIPLILFLSYFLYMIMRKSGYPLSAYGLTLKNWKPAVIESLSYTLAIILFLLLLKWFLISTFPMFHDRPLFHIHEMLEQGLGTFNWLLVTVGYALLAPVQEVMARGCLQGSLTRFLVGERKAFFSIILSNLIFSTLHLQLSLEISLYVFIVGCFWGWLYSRQKTIAGISLSHAILGIWGFTILGPL